MSINVTVHGNPISIKRGKMVLSDMESVKNKEVERRRKLRLEQVRQQSKDIASNIREKVKGETKKQLSELEKKRSNELKRWQSRRLLQLQQQYNECLHEFGSGHTQATLQPDAESILKNENRNHLKASLERGKTATKQLNLQRQQEDLEKSKPIKRKKFSRDVENVRSSMVSSLNKKNYKSKSPFKSKKKKTKVLAHIDVSTNPMTEDTDTSEYSENDENVAPSSSPETETKKKNVSKNSTVHITVQRESGSTSDPSKRQSESKTSVFSETDRSQNDSKTSEESSSARRNLVVPAQVYNDHLNNKNLITSNLDISASSHEEESKNFGTNKSSYNPRYYQETGIGNRHTLQPDPTLSYESTKNSEPKNVFYDPKSYKDSTSKPKAKMPLDTRISDLIARRQGGHFFNADDKFDSCNCHRCRSPANTVRLDSDRNQCKRCAGKGQAVNCHCSEKQCANCNRTEQNVCIEPCSHPNYHTAQNATDKYGHRSEFRTVPNRNRDDYSSGNPYNVEDVSRKTYRIPDSKIGYLSKTDDNGNISNAFMPEDITCNPNNTEKRTSKIISNPDPKIEYLSKSKVSENVSYPSKSCSCDCEKNASTSQLKPEQSLSKTVKQTSPRIQSQPVELQKPLPSNRSKVQCYDHDNRFAHDYSSQTDLVQRIDSENVDRIIAEENDEKEAILARDAKRKQEAIQRGKSAMQKDKIHRENNDLLRQLSVLQRKERLLQQRPNDPHLSEQRLQEKTKSKQKRIETAFERLYHNQIPVITLDTIERPNTGNNNVEFETVDLSSGAEPVLNVASWDAPQNVNVNRTEHTLQALLDRIRFERQLLIEEMQSLPLTSNFNQNDNNSDELKNVTGKSENESSANSSMTSTNNSKIDGDAKSVLDNGQKKSPSASKSEKKQVQTEDKQKKSKTKKQSKNKSSKSKKDETCNKKQGVLKSDANIQTSFNNIYEQPEKDSSVSFETFPSNSSNNAYKGPEIIIKVNEKDKCQTIIVGPAKKKYVCTTEQREKNYKVEEISKPEKVILTREQKDRSPTYNEKKIKNVEQPFYSQQKENLDPTLLNKQYDTKVEKNNISSGTSTTYMSPPHHISVHDPSSNQIDNNKKQRSKLDPKVQRLVNKLLTMSKRSIDELGVSSVSEISTPDFTLVCTSPNMPKAISNATINQSSILETTPRLDVSKFQLAPANGNNKNNVQIDYVESRQNESLNQLRKSIQGENLSPNVADESTLNRLFKNYKDQLEAKIDNLTSIINAMRSEREKYEMNLTGSDKEQHFTTYLDLPVLEQNKHQTLDEIVTVTSPKKQVQLPQTKITKQDNLEGIEIGVQHINLISEPSTSRQSNVLLAKSTLTAYEKNVASTKLTQPFVPILQGIPKIKPQNDNLPNQNASVKFDFSSSGSSTLFLPKAESSNLPQMNPISSTESSFESNGNQQSANAAPTSYQRLKPPASLKRSVLKHNIESDSIVAHELSTIVEVDTPAASKNVSRFSEHGRKKDEIQILSEPVSEILAELEMETQEYQKIVSENEHMSDKLSGLKLLSSTADSASSPDHLEALLNELGLSWAMSTLKKTEQMQALSSSSSSQDVSFGKLGIKFSFNSSNGNSSGNTKNTSEEFKEFHSTSFDDKSSPSMPQLIVRNTPESTPLVPEIKDVSKRQQSSREKSQGRTSTPVVDNSTHYSQGEGHGELFTGESDISSVNPVANIQNIALTVPNLSLNIERSRKNHSNNSNS